jgi:hypothetical protein
MPRPLPLRFSLIAIVLLGFVLSALVVAQRGDARLRIIMSPLDGNGALAITPEGHTILIDGGSDGAALAAWLGEKLPFATRQIDLLVLNQADARTLPGQLAAIKRYRIGRALLPEIKEETTQTEAWQEWLDEQGTPVHIMQPGDRVRIGSSIIDVLTAHTEQTTFALRWKQTTHYFLQALDASVENTLAKQQLPPATLVVFPWAYPTDVPLLHQLAPEAIVFSEGGDRDPLQSFAQRRVGAAQLLHKEINGEISVASDGQHTEIRVERKEVP